MDALIEYLDPEELVDVLEKYPEIENLDDEDIKAMIGVLSSIGLNATEIGEVIYSNPDYFNMTEEETHELVGILKRLGITDISSLVVESPWILNRDAVEVRDFVLRKRKEGVPTLDIINMIEDDEIDD